MSAAYAYDACTTHARLTPVRRRFGYRLFMLYLDVDRVADAQTRLFSHNRPNIFSFRDNDHGDGSGAPLRAWAESALREAGVDLNGGEIRLLTFPRMLGYVFNPLSIFFGFNRAGALKGVIYEVRNTFGEKHSYVFAVNDNALPHRHAAPKRFHVSPFMDVHGEYRFAIAPPEELLSLTIDNVAGGALEHRATLAGKRVALSDWRLLRVLFGLPFMTLGVSAAIHWQAVKIWAAGIGYRAKPAAPEAPLTIGGGVNTVLSSTKIS